MMLRRNFLKWTTLAAACGASPAAYAEGGENKVVYHLDDREKIAMALGNIQNHFNAFSDGGRVDIALVVIGEPLGDFRLGADAERTTPKLRGLVDKGLTPYACANTMAWLKLTLADLAPGFQIAEKGGVVKLAELQRRGYAYIRP
jgi:intracellular sulfur oxidation DsrE/DsrF family protein